MKKSLLLLVLGLLLSQTAYCQLQKGNIQLGGSANVSRQQSENMNGGQYATSNYWNSTTLNPTFGYFFTDKWVAGLNLQYHKSNSMNSFATINLMTNEYKYVAWGTGIFLRKYFPLHEKLALFGEFQSIIQRNNSDRTTVSNNISESTSEVHRVFHNQLNAGVSLFPAKWVSIEASVNPFYIGHSKRIDENDNILGQPMSYTSVNMGLNSSAVFLGFNFFLNRK